jgi:putative hemolysin
MVAPAGSEVLRILFQFCLGLVLTLVASLAGLTSAWALANPASVFCVQQGGTLRPQPDGRNDCRLPNGRVVEEWDYFRAQHKRAQPRR